MAYIIVILCANCQSYNEEVTVRQGTTVADYLASLADKQCPNCGVSGHWA